MSSERTMIFCQTRKQCALVYAAFKESLGNEFFINEEPDSKGRLMEMFHAGTPESVKKHILSNMSQTNGHIRVLACTVAFGMGVNCKGVHRVIHFGPSKNLECYVQECGRSGRDGQPSSCLLLHNGLLGAHCNDDIKNYIPNSTGCRRKHLYSHFPGKFTSSVSGHQCCDICAKTCECGQEICKEPTTLVFEVREDGLPSESVRTVEEKEKLQLRMELFQYMKNLLIHNTSGPVASVNMLHEFTPLHIKQVLDNCDKIKTVQDVEKFIEVWRKEHSRAILGAIHQVFGDVACGELEALEKEVDGMEEFAQEWADIRDDSELCQLLSESDYLDVDVQMEEIDQSGNEEVNVSSMIAGLFK